MSQNARHFLRRIHISQLKHGALDRLGFRPTEVDTDGISIYDADLVSPAQLKAGARRPPSEYRIASISEADLIALGLTLEPTPDKLPGHFVVTEMNRGDYDDEAKKPTVVELMDKLGGIARLID